MKKQTCTIETTHYISGQHIIVQRVCEDLNFAFSIMILLNAMKNNLEKIYNQPYSKIYYIIDKVIDQLIENKEIPEKHGFHISAMNATLKGESFFTDFLGVIKSDIADDILPDPNTVSIKISY